MTQHSKEYLDYLKSKRWKFIGGLNKALWFGRCSFRPWQKANQCHHLHYKTKFGWERPIWDTIPVSASSHKILERKPWKVKIKAGNRWIAQPKLRAKMNKLLRVIVIVNWFFALAHFIIFSIFDIIFWGLKMFFNPISKLLSTFILK